MGSTIYGISPAGNQPFAFLERIASENIFRFSLGWFICPSPFLILSDISAVGDCG
jgi:hypothetical protein